MKKTLMAMAVSLSLWGCAGYEPLYHSTQEVMSNVAVGDVEMTEFNYASTSRRSAQLLNQKLSQTLTQGNNPEYLVFVELTEDKTTLAVARDASDERLELNLGALVVLKDTKDQAIFQTRVESSAPYNIEDSPYATESGKERARLSAVNVLSEEILHRLSFFFYNQKKVEG